jgi:hypothetical protein
LEKAADEVTAELLDWLATVAPGIPANASTLATPLRKAGIDLRLARTTPRTAARTAASPLTIELDYLVTVQLPDAAAEQQITTELMFAAMARQDLEVLGGDEVARVSAALGLPLAPGLILRTSLTRERLRRPDRIRPPTTAPAPPPAQISGRVVGPADAPVDGATVEAVGRDGAVTTDSLGRFRIPAAGPEGAAVRLVARSGGTEVEAVAVAGLPVTLRLPLKP